MIWPVGPLPCRADVIEKKKRRNIRQHQPGDRFNNRISLGDARLAEAAFPAELDPPKHRNVVIPLERFIAFGQCDGGSDSACIDRKKPRTSPSPQPLNAPAAADHHIQKTTDTGADREEKDNIDNVHRLTVKPDNG